MDGAFLDKLQVMVIGVDAAIARDVVRLVIAEGASVIAADRDAAKLARLDRDVGLYRTCVETAVIDLASAGEVRLWETTLRAFGRLPHLMICCCGSPACPPFTPARGRSRRPSGDVALSEHRTKNCPARFAEQMLQPTLFLHAEPLRRSVFDRALAVLRHPTLRGLLERAPGRDVFNPETPIPYVRIASRLYSLRRPADGEIAPNSLRRPADGESAPTGRIRLTPPAAKTARRDAA
jgi:hypothetical protein